MMPSIENEAEQRLLRSIRRRRFVLGLLIIIPVCTTLWFGGNNLAKRLDIAPDVMRAAWLLAFFVFTLAFPYWPFREEIPDKRETPRLRWLRQERAARKSRAVPWVAMVVIAGLLIMQLNPLLTLTPSPPEKSDGTPFMLLSLVGVVRWRFSELGDEGARERMLVAVYRAFLVTFLALIAAIVFDDWHPGLFRPAAITAMLIGALTLQLNLLRSEPRLDPEDP